MRLRSGSLYTNDINSNSNGCDYDDVDIHNIYDDDCSENEGSDLYDYAVHKISKYMRKRGRIIEKINKKIKPKYAFKLIKYEKKIYKSLFKYFNIGLLVSTCQKSKLKNIYLRVGDYFISLDLNVIQEGVDFMNVLKVYVEELDELECDDYCDDSECCEIKKSYKKSIKKIIKYLNKLRAFICFQV